MARKRPPPTAGAPNPPSSWKQSRYPGVFYTTTWRGIPVVKKWPRKATKAENAKKLDACNLFNERVKAMKLELPETLVAAQDMAQGTYLLPRDVLMMLYAGTFWGALVVDGQAYYPARMTKQVSEALDAITRETGAILYRGPDGWVGLLPGATGQVLALQGDPPVPTWLYAGAGASLSYTAEAPYGDVSTTPYATKGQILDPTVSFPVRILSFWVFPDTNSTYRLSIWRVSGSTLVERLYQAEPQSVAAGSEYAITGQPPEPLTFNAGERYLLAITDITGTGTRPCRVINQGAPVRGLPYSPVVNQWARIASIDPQPGNVLELGVPGGPGAAPYLAG